ncbi:MAG TPA: class I SAM-dependent methyltransferase [Polyangiaceae bacterium]|nr:class I SAM-dependent methyltransferase [Polyangiaceae bacterium]
MKAGVGDGWAIGAAYDAYMGRWSRPLARAFVSWLEPAPRRHWLDVGCGTGAVSAAICELGNPASIVACDPSGPFIDYARDLLPDKRVGFELATAEHLPEREGGFDLVVSGLVLNFISAPERALAAMRARLSAEGCIAAYVWDYAGGMEFLRCFWEVAVEQNAAAAAFDERQRFASCNPTQLAASFRAAGLEKVETTALDSSVEFVDFDDFWQPFLGRTGPAPSYLAALDPAQRERLKERLRERLEAGHERRLEFPARAWAVRGRR